MKLNEMLDKDDENVEKYLKHGGGVPGYVKDKKLKDLTQVPTKLLDTLDGDFFLESSNLNSLDGNPHQTVHGGLWVAKNDLSDFIGFPAVCTSQVDISDNNFRSLKGIHKHIKKVQGSMDLRDNPISEHVLGLLFIEGLSGLSLNSLHDDWGDIVHAAIRRIHKAKIQINSELHRELLFKTQEELIKADCHSYAFL